MTPTTMGYVFETQRETVGEALDRLAEEVGGRSIRPLFSPSLMERRAPKLRMSRADGTRNDFILLLLTAVCDEALRCC